MVWCGGDAWDGHAGGGDPTGEGRVEGRQGLFGVEWREMIRGEGGSAIPGSGIRGREGERMVEERIAVIGGGGGVSACCAAAIHSWLGHAALIQEGGV